MASLLPPNSSVTSRGDTDRLGNTAACEPHPTSTFEDTKHDDAASLAIQLGSQSSWSEAFSPRPGPDAMTQFEEDAQNHDEEEDDDELEDTIGPPPAYTNMPGLHDLSSSPIRAIGEHHTERDVEEQSDMYGPGLRSVPASIHEPDVLSPLLGSSIRTSGDSPSSWWLPERTKSSHRKYCAIASGAAVLVVLIVGIIIAVLKRDQLFYNHPSPARPSATYVPTDRVYERHETIGDIQGGFKLYEKLDLSTTTGSIDIELDPQPGDGPALLLLASDLGSVVVRLSEGYKKNKHRPQRTILTEIHTFTGFVVAELALGFGGSIEIHTSVGRQDLMILVDGVGASDPVSNITTVSSTGNQQIRVMPLNPKPAISAVQAKHHSLATGNLDIVYPDTWLGIVEAYSGIGNVAVGGEDLVYSKKDDRYVRARRGRESDDRKLHIISDGTGGVVFNC